MWSDLIHGSLPDLTIDGLIKGTSLQKSAHVAFIKPTNSPNLTRSQHTARDRGAQLVKSLRSGRKRAVLRLAPARYPQLHD